MVGKAKKLGFNSTISDIEMFTDREHHRELFLRKLKEVSLSVDKNDEEFSAIFFHGLAGIGKSFLLNYLKYTTDHMSSVIKPCPEFSGKTIHSVICDFEKVYSRRDIIILLMTTMVADLGFSFPLTAAALLRTATRDEDNDWKLDNLADKVSGNRSVGIVISLLKCFAPFGNMVGLVQDLKDTMDDTKGENDLWRAFDKALKNSDDRRLLNYIRSDMNSVQTIDRNLHEFFSYDLRRNINDWKDGEKGPIVIFLDTFEFYQDKLKLPGSTESVIWLQNTIESVPYVLWVISGREKLYEYSQGSGWEDCGIEQIAVERFQKKDVADYLFRYGISDPEVHEKFFELSGGIPYLLRILCERFENLRQSGKEHLFDEYGKDNEEIIDRYLRYLKSKDNKASNLLYQLSLFKDGWTDAMIRTMNRNLEYFDKSVYDVVCRDSVVEHCEDGSYRIQRSIREIIEKQAEIEMPEMVKKTTELLKNHYINEVKHMHELDSVIPMIRLLELCADEEKKKVFSDLMYRKLKLFAYWQNNNAVIILAMLKPLADSETVNQRFLNDYLLLSIVLESNTDKQKAYELARNKNELWISRFGEDNLNLLDEIASLAESFNRYEAIEVRKYSYELSVKKLGENHHETLRRERKLAMIYAVDPKRHEEAYQTLKNCLQRSEDAFGKNHHDTIVILSALSRYCLKFKDLKKQDEALLFARERIQRTSEVYGQNHRYTINAMEPLIRIYTALGRNKEAACIAETYCQRIAHEIGECNPSYLMSLELLSKCYSRINRSEEAAAILEDCCNRSIQILGEFFPDTLNRVHRLASMYASLNRFDEAVITQEKSYQLTARDRGENDFKTLGEMLFLADYLNQAGRIHDALIIAEECYKKTVDVFGSDYPFTKNCLELVLSIKDKNC